MNARRDTVLNVVLLGSIALVALLDLSLAYNSLTNADKGVSFAGFSAVLAFFVFLYVLSRKGHRTVASYGVVLFYLACAGYSSFLWGASLPAALLAYALVVIIASVLLGSRSGFILAFAVFGGLILVGKREIGQGVLPPWRLHPVTLSDVNAYAFLLLLIALVSWLSNRETERSLKRALESEAALEEKNATLEATVLERTSELERLQAEKVSELYRFAEFGRLSSGIFHDLMSPLSAVTAGVASLDGVHPEVPEIRDSLDRTMSAAKRLESFLVTARRQLRDDEVSGLFSVNESIEETVSLLSYKARKAGVALEFSAAEMIKTFGNASKFGQAAVNLVSNAIDAYEGVPDDGRERCVRIILRKKAGTILLSVFDKGCGVPEAFLEKVFDPLFSTKDRHRGMGIGLSTTKSIIEKSFGGTVRLRSTEGSGSRFDISIPERHARP